MPSIYYPVRPFALNQKFGDNQACVANYGKANQSVVSELSNGTCPIGYVKLYPLLGMKGHDGNDLRAGVQNVYAAMDGVVIEQQNNARFGLGLGIVSNAPLDLGVHGTHYLKLRYWHLQSFYVHAGDTVKAGDLIGVSDNTGFSAGNHLHFEGDPMYKDAHGNYILSEPNNGYGGAIDTAQWFNGTYADAIKQENIILIKLIGVLTNLINALKGSNK